MDHIDESKCFYMILHVIGSINQDWETGEIGRKIERAARAKDLRIASPRKMYREAIRCVRQLGITLIHMRIRLDELNNREHCRFVFRFPRYTRRDEEAEAFGESFIYSMELLHGPVIYPEYYDSFVFRIPASLVRNAPGLSYKHLDDLEANRPYDERVLPWRGRSLSLAVGTSEDVVAEAWRITPIVFQNEHLRRALMFLSQSYHHFYVFPGQIRDIIADPERLPATSRVQGIWENALHNAFKAVEAIIGDPPKDDRKLCTKLRAIGLDPSYQIDFRYKKTTLQVLREMSGFRDKKSAHGSTPHRALAIADLHRFQEFSSIVVQSAIEHELGRPIYE